MEPKSKLYLVVRADLSAGQQAVQAAHAMREYAALFPERERLWFESSNHLALLAVPGQNDLMRLRDLASARGVEVAAFHEPDRGGEMTAIALGPDGKPLCKGLQLALQPTRGF